METWNAKTKSEEENIMLTNAEIESLFNDWVEDHREFIDLMEPTQREKFLSAAKMGFVVGFRKAEPYEY